MVLETTALPTELYPYARVILYHIGDTIAIGFCEKVCFFEKFFVVSVVFFSAEAEDG